MTNKMVARVLTDELGSYDDSELKKWINLIKRIVLSLVYGQRVFLDAMKNGTIFSCN